MGTTWEKIDTLVRGLVEDHLDTSDRLARLHRIGVDEIAYRKGRKFLTVVTDHDTGRVVHLAEGRTSAAFAGFYALLGPDRRQLIEAVTMDMTSIYREPTREHLPQAAICFDPFHVIKWAGDSLNAAHTSLTKPKRPITVAGLTPAQTWRRIRTTLRAAAENLDDTGRAIIEQLRLRHRKLCRAWQLKERLRDLYRTVAPPTPPPTSKPGSPPRNAAGSPASSPLPAASPATSTASSTPSTTTCRTPSPKASTPASASSKPAPTATPTSPTSSK